MSRRNPLAGVLRARAVRERDSRLGLTQALQEQRQADQAAAEQAHQLRQAAPFEAGSATAFGAHLALLEARRRAVTEAEETARVARSVAAAAQARWQDDKARLRAVEKLAARRTEAHRRELVRRLTAELDDLAAQQWIRRGGTS